MRALSPRPTTIEITEYMEGYVKEYLDAAEIKTATTVVGVEKIGNVEEKGWRVRFQERGKEVKERGFEFLVIATGVFSEPFLPELPGKGEFKGTVKHVAKYDGGKLFSGEDPAKWPKRIVVVGGELSGTELAADIALRVASLPEEVRKEMEVIQVLPRPSWQLPKLQPFEDKKDEKKVRVMCLDLVTGNAVGLSQMPKTKGIREQWRMLHTVLTMVNGSDQSELGPEKHVSEQWRDELVSLGVSDNYRQFLLANSVTWKIGKVTSFPSSDSIEITTTLPGQPSTTSTLPNIDLVLFATGYTPWPTLSRILPQEIIQALPRKDLTSRLYNSTFHPSLGSSGAFIGFQKRPYYLIFELQSRYISLIFTNAISFPPTSNLTRLASGDDCSDLVETGELIPDGDSTPFAFMKTLLPILQPGVMTSTNILTPALKMEDGGTGQRPYISAHLPPFPPGADPSPHSVAAVNELQRYVIHDTNSPAYLGRYIFAQLHGSWTLSRRIISALPGFPSGVFTGTAMFHPRLPTFESSLVDGVDGCAAGPEPRRLAKEEREGRYTLGMEVWEYLYTETGVLKTDTGIEFNARREYIYRLSPDTGVITVWFVAVGSENQKGTVDKYFHTVRIAGREGDEEMGRIWGDKCFEGVRWEVERQGGVKASGEHLCARDWYWPSYRWEFAGAEGGRRLKRWGCRYKVEGPEKRYVAEGVYTRD